MTQVFDLAKSKFRHEVHLYDNRGHHKAADSYFHGLGQNKSFWNGSISLKFIVCNHFEAFSVCCYVIITELARYNERKKDSRGYPVVGPFSFRRLDRNGSIWLKCMVYNHFVVLSVCCYAIITEWARYNERKKDSRGYPVVGPFSFRRLDRNGSIWLKCMVYNHFVVLSVRCYAIITEWARYNEKKIDSGTLWWTTCLQSSCGIIKWVPKDI